VELTAEHHRRCHAATPQGVHQDKLQNFFDAADDLVDAKLAKGFKRWLQALRDSTTFKVAYA
jgi:hypothetical protein